MDNSNKPEVSEEHLKSMAEHYGTIGEMTRKDFDKKIVLELSSLLHNPLGIGSGIADNDLKQLFRSRNGDCVSIGKKGLIMNIEFPNIFFKTSDGKDIEHLEKYLAQNSISKDEFKELVLNALYINLKTPFCVNELGITTDKTRELATGVLEAGSDTKPDEIKSEEELRVKKNREILQKVLYNNGFPDNFIDTLDRVEILLNVKGLKFIQEHGNRELKKGAKLYPNFIPLSLKDFLTFFDLSKLSNSELEKITGLHSNFIPLSLKDFLTFFDLSKLSNYLANNTIYLGGGKSINVVNFSSNDVEVEDLLGK